MQHRSAFILYLFISTFYCEVMQSSFLIFDQKAAVSENYRFKNSVLSMLKKTFSDDLRQNRTTARQIFPSVL